jgi:hypothetical protein
MIQNNKVPQSNEQQPGKSSENIEQGFGFQEVSPSAPQPKENQTKAKRLKPSFAVRLYHSYRRRKQYSPRPSIWERASIYFTAVIALCTGVQACIYWQQKGIMESSSRPYVGVTEISPKHNQEVNATDILATINNFGSRPAFDVSATWIGTINGKPIITIGRGQKPFTLFPKRPVYLQARIDRTEWERIEAEEDSLIYKILISYRFTETGPMIEQCERDEYFPLVKAFFPESCVH